MKFLYLNFCLYIFIRVQVVRAVNGAKIVKGIRSLRGFIIVSQDCAANHLHNKHQQMQGIIYKEVEPKCYRLNSFMLFYCFLTFGGYLINIVNFNQYYCIMQGSLNHNHEDHFHNHEDHLHGVNLLILEILITWIMRETT